MSPVTGPANGGHARTVAPGGIAEFEHKNTTIGPLLPGLPTCRCACWTSLSTADVVIQLERDRIRLGCRREAAGPSEMTGGFSLPPRSSSALSCAAVAALPAQAGKLTDNNSVTANRRMMGLPHMVSTLSWLRRARLRAENPPLRYDEDWPREISRQATSRSRDRRRAVASARHGRRCLQLGQDGGTGSLRATASRLLPEHRGRVATRGYACSGDATQ